MLTKFLGTENDRKQRLADESLDSGMPDES